MRFIDNSYFLIFSISTDLIGRKKSPKIIALAHCYKITLCTQCESQLPDIDCILWKGDVVSAQTFTENGNVITVLQTGIYQQYINMLNAVVTTLNKNIDEN